MSLKTTLSKKVTAILSREKELKEQLRPLEGDSFWNARAAALEGARQSNPTAEEIAAATEAVDGRLEQKMFGQRQILSSILQKHREESFPTFRDEFLVPALETRKARRAQLDQDITALRVNYPGLRVSYDQTWDEGTISQLQEFCWLDQLAPRHLDMEEMVEHLRA